MKFIKKFESFVNEEAQPAPATRPDTKPDRTSPDTKPGKNPSPGKRPSPIRRDKPSEQPGPKGQKKGNLPTASEEEVAERFMALMKEKGESYKKFVK